MDCPLCNRCDIRLRPSDHHLVPKCRGGTNKDKKIICRDCHDAIHAQFSNKELDKNYRTVDSLLTNETFSKTVKYISKQPPTRRIKTKLSNNQKRRGRNG